AMLHANLPVPPGFCLTTTAYELGTRTPELEQILDRLAATPPGEAEQLKIHAAAARDTILAAPLPDEIIEATSQAYSRFASGKPIPMAVRSSATAEDLPFASFAGQQDTFLNIIGIEAILDAIRRCWASLWSERAVSYRASNGIDPRTVCLAVVIQ